MNVIAFNGSPRKNMNTAALLNKALEGAAANGANTTLVHLYDLQFTGCRSCFACKRLGSPTYGTCAWPDDLQPVLEQARTADALIFGTPIYLRDVTAQMRALVERLFFCVHAYDTAISSLWENPPRSAIIYTMGVKDFHDFAHLHVNFKGYIERHLGAPEILYSYDAYQFDDYSKYYCPMFNVQEKEAHRKDIFPLDCQRAYQIGKNLTAKQ